MCFQASQRFPVSVRVMGGSVLRFYFLNLLDAQEENNFSAMFFRPSNLSSIQLLQSIMAIHLYMLSTQEQVYIYREI